MRLAVMGSLCARTHFICGILRISGQAASIPALPHLIRGGYCSQGWWRRGYSSFNSNCNHTPVDSSEHLSSDRVYGVTVGYVSDLEGAIAHWDAYLSQSKVLLLLDRPDEKGRRVVLRDNCHFVFGGDVCDHGSGDIQILRELVDLKERYPSRVHLILGNRDVNKLRIQAALHPKVLASAPKVYWLRDPVLHCDAAQHSTVQGRLRWILNSTMGASKAFEMRKAEMRQLLPGLRDATGDSLDPASHEEFGFLAITAPSDGILIRYLELAQISVVLGDVMFVHGGVLAFNQGWIPPSLSDTVGGLEDDARQWSRTINAFASSEVKHYREQLRLFLDGLWSSPSGTDALIWDPIGGYTHPQPGSRLVQYAMGWLSDRTRNPTAIYASYLANGEPMNPLNPALKGVAQWLNRSGIRRLCVGHQPTGDAPMVLRVASDDDALEVYIPSIISADNSYSKNVLWHRDQLQALRSIERIPVCRDVSHPGDWMTFDDYLTEHQLDGHPLGQSDPRLGTRSRHCVVEVLFRFPTSPSCESKEEEDNVSVCQFEGTLSNNNRFRFELDDAAQSRGPSCLIGRMTVDGWLVKGYGVTRSAAALKDEEDEAVVAAVSPTSDEYFLVSLLQPGYRIYNRLLLVDDLLKELS